MLKSKAAPNAEHQDERGNPAGAGMNRGRIPGTGTRAG